MVDEPVSAAALRALHQPGEPLVLPNAWDAGSARAVVAAGFPAVATSSSAVAESMGYADHEAAPAAQMLAAVARIAAAVPVPVTADLERGYGMAPAELVERLAATGAVGCNLEDSDPRTGRLLPVAEQADYLAAVRAAATAAGIDLVLNARIDVYIRDLPPPEAAAAAARAADGAAAGDAATEPSADRTPSADRLAAAVERARAYLSAGADCAYPIVASDPAHIAALTREAGGPVNILLTPRSPGIAALADLGVARISMGGGLYHLAESHLAALLSRIATGESPYPPVSDR